MRIGDWIGLACLCGLGFATAPAAGAELVVTSGALERVLVEQVFGKEGRLHFAPPTACSHAYLDAPKVSMAKGRVTLAGRLHGRAGMPSGDGCLEAMNETLDVVASGRPFFRNGRIGLDDVRIDQLSNEFYRPILQPLLFATVGRVVDIDLRDAVRRMLAAGRQPVSVDVERLDVSRLAAENDRLEASFDFRAVAY